MDSSGRFPFLRMESVVTRGLGQPAGGPASPGFLQWALLVHTTANWSALLSTYNTMDPVTSVL